MQRRATRFILKNSSKLSYKDRLIKLKLLPLHYWLEYLDLVLFFKCVHGHIDLTRSFNYYLSFVASQTRRAWSGLNLKISKGYFEATRRYVIYSPRAQPEVNKSHIHEVPQNNWLIFLMGEVSHGQGINRDMILFVVRTLTKQTNK